MAAKSAWWPGRIDALRRLWLEGKTASEIALELGPGFSRNSVIGKAHRLGLPPRPSPLGGPTPGWRGPLT